MSSEARQKASEVGTVALVSVAHFWSHFYVLVIPSCLPLMRGEFDSSYVVLGTIIMAYGLMSAVWQYPAGVLSDRFGAAKFVVGGLFLVSAMMFCQSLAPAIWVMAVIAGFAGFADSVFHPADYTIITAKVREPWLGKAYAIHTFTGFLGFAAAPTVMSFLLLGGDWRYAIAVVGAAGFVTAIALLLCRSLLVGTTYQPKVRAGAPQQQTNLIKFLLMPPLLMMFLFYLSGSLASNGIQSFGNSAMIEVFNVDIVQANTALAIYLWGNTLGVLIGGLVADRFKRFDFAATVGNLGGAIAIAFIGMAVMPFIAVMPAIFIAGFALGAVMPARDLMVRAVAPPGGIGKAFGYVSSAFGVGGVVGPLVYGTLMDLHMPQIIFFVSASMMLVTIGTALAASWIAKRAVEKNLAASAAQPQAQPAE